MDKYVVEKVLGIGGMGAVVAARRKWDGVEVALKVMLAEEAKHEDSTRRFFREARAAGVIDSPHVAKLLDFGRLDDGTPFMVLELLRGEGLDAIIRRHAPMAIADAVDLILQAAEGIGEAHARGIVHRDIKPSNLFVTRAADGSPLLKVLDFGISKATLKFEQGTEASSLTETNATLGSPQYMSPEQLKSSKDVDSRTDIWSLGLILYKMLVGRPAFEAPNVGAHFAMILSEPPTRLTERRPDAPEALADVIWTCLEKECDRRWQDLGQLARALVPFGSRSAAVRAARISAILEEAGVSSSSTPRLSWGGGDLPTVREAPMSKRPSLAPPLPPPPRLPTGLGASEPASELGEHTRSAWSPVTGRFRRPSQKARAVMLGVGLAALVATAFVAGRLLSEDETAAAAPAVSSLAGGAPSAARDADKARWLARARDGTATDDELRKLEALCVLEGDDRCVKLSQRARDDSSGPEAPAPAASSTPSSKATPRAPARPRGPAPPPEPVPAPSPEPTPSPKITPKGPMVDTL